MDDEKLSLSSVKLTNEKEREGSAFTAIQRAINPMNSSNINLGLFLLFLLLSHFNIFND